MTYRSSVTLPARVLLLACLVLLLIVNAVSVEGQAKEPAAITEDRVRLRDGPGLKSATLSYLNKGDAVEVIDTGSLQYVGDTLSYWRKVRTADAREGWVYGAFLKSADPDRSPLLRWVDAGDAPDRDSGSRYLNLATDSAGNSFVVGSVTGTGLYKLGDRLKVAGSSDGENALLVKYDSTGTAVWGHAAVGIGGQSRFAAVATDKAGSVFAAGHFSGRETFQFGNGVNITGIGPQQNAIVAKYDAAGAVLWARSVVSGSGDTSYDAVAVDPRGNVYVAGTSTGNGVYGFGGDVTAKGSAEKDVPNVLLVKYDPFGTVLWARTLSSGTKGAVFTAVAVDGEGNIIAAGSVDGSQRYGFGSSITVTGGRDEFQNPLLVKYGPEGNTLWAQEASAGRGRGDISGMGVDSSGGISIVGSFFDTDKLSLGDGVTLTAAHKDGGNPYVVSYSSQGRIAWARTAAGTGVCELAGMTVAGGGAVYAVGQAAGTVTWGNVTTTTEKGKSLYMLKLGADGDAQWAELAPLVNRFFAVDDGSLAAAALGADGSLRVVGKTIGQSQDDIECGLLEAF